MVGRLVALAVLATILLALGIQPVHGGITNRTTTGQSYQSNHHLQRGDPISTFSGKEVFTEAPDLNLGGPLPVFFQRHYDGALFDDGVVQSALGHNWQHNWDIRLTVAGTNATLAFRQGRIVRFGHDGANWNLVGRFEIGFRLVADGGGFIMGDPRSQIMYFFDSGGLLTRIEDGRGNTNFLAYAGNRLTNVNDGLGRNLNLTYNSSGRLTNVTDGVRAVSYSHTGTNLTSATGANGQVTIYAYDLASSNNPGLLTTRTLPEGNTPVTQIYEAAGRVIAQTDAAGNTNSFAYDVGAITFTTTMTDPLGFTTAHVYNEVGELEGLTDEAGLAIQAFPDDAGRRSGVIDRKGVLFTVDYDPVSGLPLRIFQSPANVRDEFFYTNRTANGIVFQDVIQHNRPDLRTNRMAYDGVGNLTQYVLRDGASFNYGYNNRGQVTASTNPVGGVAAFTYDANARLATAADVDVGATTYQYDALHRLTNVVNPDASSAAFAFDALDRPTRVTDERGNSTRMVYDHNSRLTAITNALNQTARFEYDGLNRLTRAQDRLGNSTRYAYDPRQQLAAVTNRNGFVTRLQYDARQHLTGVVNPAGQTNRFGYDAEGLLIAATNPVGETVTLGRDAMGYVTRVTDALGNSAGLQLDTMKRPIGLTNALGNKTIYAYTPRGQLQSVTLPNGIRSTNRYDGNGALTNLVDPNNRNWIFTRTPMGRLASLIDPLNRTNVYTYDTRGRLARVNYPDGVTVTNTYDAANNLTRLQYTDGTDLQFAYDALDRLTNATGSDPITFAYDAMDRITNTRQVGLDFGATYDAGGRLVSVNYNNGQFTVTYDYDSRDRLTSVSDSLTGTTMTFNYDDANRLTGITRPNGVNTTYTRDAAGRLTRIQDGGVTNIIDLKFTLDAAGRITKTDYAAVPLDPGAALTTENTSFTYDNASQLNTGGYSYDARGRQTASPGNTFTWDGASRLRSINSVSLAYNALSDLVTRVESGNTNRFFYNYALGLNPIMAERNDNTGQFTRFYVWSPGGWLLYLINLPGNTVSFPHFDQVGSTLALTDPGGAVTDSYAYDPYGMLLAQTGSSPQTFRFNGAFGVRADGSLHHMRARWYDANAGRFISKEPIWPVLSSPKQLNVFQFALQNPASFVDPLGTDPIQPQPGSITRSEGDEDLINHLVTLLALGSGKGFGEHSSEDNKPTPAQQAAADEVFLQTQRTLSGSAVPGSAGELGANPLAQFSVWGTGTPAAAPPRQRKPIWPNPRPRTVTIQAGLFEASSPGVWGGAPCSGSDVKDYAMDGYSSDATAQPQETAAASPIPTQEVEPPTAHGLHEKHGEVDPNCFLCNPNNPIFRNAPVSREKW